MAVIGLVGPIDRLPRRIAFNFAKPVQARGQTTTRRPGRDLPLIESRDSRQTREYPYVVLRIDCNLCGHKRAYRLARLAVRCGPDADLERVLRDLVRKCPYAQRPQETSRNQYLPHCKAFLPDLRERAPTDLPPPSAESDAT